MELFYHYTKLNSFEKIADGIRNGSMYLRASNAKKMKDRTDCYYLIKSLDKIKNINDVNIGEILREKETFDNPYIVSLTNSEDDLYMWKNYGDNCNGIAIGIEDLYTITRDFFLKYHLPAHFYKCIYKNSDDIKEWKELNKLINTTNSNIREISNISNIVKDSNYIYENEYRIVIEYGKNEHTYDRYNETEDTFRIPIPISAVKKIFVGHSANYEEIKKTYSTIFQDAEFVKSKIDIEEHE